MKKKMKYLEKYFDAFLSNKLLGNKRKILCKKIKKLWGVEQGAEQNKPYN